MCFLTRFPVHIHFTPTLEGEVNFNLICDVKKKSQSLCLNVKATGHTMNVSVKCEESHGVVTELDPEHPKQIDFREVRGPRAEQGWPEQTCGKLGDLLLSTSPSSVCFASLLPTQYLQFRDRKRSAACPGQFNSPPPKNLFLPRPSGLEAYDSVILLLVVMAIPNGSPGSSPSWRVRPGSELLGGLKVCWAFLMLFFRSSQHFRGTFGILSFFQIAHQNYITITVHHWYFVRKS